MELVFILRNDGNAASRSHLEFLSGKGSRPMAHLLHARPQCRLPQNIVPLSVTSRINSEDLISSCPYSRRTLRYRNTGTADTMLKESVVTQVANRRKQYSIPKE